MERYNYKLKTSLYSNYDDEVVSDSPDFCNGKLEDGWNLFAKKGQVAERVEIDDDLRNETNIDNIYKTMYKFKNGHYVLFQENDACELTWFGERKC